MFKKFKKAVTVAIIFAIISAMFVPSISVQAAEKQADEAAVASYVDVENSEYKFINVNLSSSDSLEITYSVPKTCYIILAVYDGVTNKMTQLEKQSIDYSNHGYKYFFLNEYGNRKFTYKLFFVDENNRPLGKSYSEDVEITDYVETPSLCYDVDAPPVQPLKEDSGYFSDLKWSVDKNGLLKLEGNMGPFLSGKNITPWSIYRDSITAIEYPEDTYYIGTSILYGLSKVKSFTVSKELSYYSETILSNMEGLETIVFEARGEYNSEIPYSNRYYPDCPNIKQFVVEPGDSDFISVNGIIYSRDMTTLYAYPRGKSDTVFVVPDTVEYISEYAFEGAKNLKKVVMSDNVLSIGYYAFANCTSLSSINIPSKLEALCDGAFYNCTSLNMDIVIPETCECVSTSSFELSGIKSVYFPSSLDGDYFYYWENNSVESINLSNGYSDLKSVDGVIYNADMTRLIAYPSQKNGTSFTIPDSVNEIGTNAFNNCTKLENIVIGKNVSSMYDGAFKNCTSLKNVIFNCGNIDYAGSSLFEGCTSLESISLSKFSTLTENMFKDCTSLKNVDLDGVCSLYGNAFKNCTSLEEIYVPASLTSIENYSYENAFYGCNNLKRFVVSENNPTYCALDDCICTYDSYSDKYTLVEFPGGKTANYTIPDQIYYISSGAFMGYDKLVSVTLSENINSLGSSVFADCKNLKKVVLSENVTYIGEYTFSGCTSLRDINLDYNISCIANFAFCNCKSLKTLDLSNNYGILLNDNAFSGAGLESVELPRFFDSYNNPFIACYNLRTIKFNGDAQYRSPLYMFFGLTNLTVLYPNNANWTSGKMRNIEHKDAIKWQEYKVAYSGTDKGTYTFTGLKPNTEYIVGTNVVVFSENFVNNGITYYIDQQKSDSNGTIVMNYAMQYPASDFVPFVLGTADFDINDAEITVNDALSTGFYESKPVVYSVKYDGVELIEGIDYIVPVGNGYYSPGEYEFSIIGTGNFYGTASQEYNVYDTYDVNGDGFVNIIDATDIQRYLLGIKELENPAGADVDGNGEVTINDVTALQKWLAFVV